MDLCWYSLGDAGCLQAVCSAVPVTVPDCARRRWAVRAVMCCESDVTVLKCSLVRGNAQLGRAVEAEIWHGLALAGTSRTNPACLQSPIAGLLQEVTETRFCPSHHLSELPAVIGLPSTHPPRLDITYTPG